MSHRALSNPRCWTAAAALLVASATTTALVSPDSGASKRCSALQAQQSSQKSQSLDRSAYQKVSIPQRAQASTHAIYGSLMHPTGIVRYDVYRCTAAIPTIQRYQETWLELQRTIRPLSKEQQQLANADSEMVASPLEVVTAQVQFGTGLDGHIGTVHGGILALMMDDFLGHAYESLGIPLAVTANLNLNFRAPVPANSHVVLHAQLTRWEGRKVYWTVQLMNGDVCCCEATCLYIVPRDKYDEMLDKGFGTFP